MRLAKAVTVSGGEHRVVYVRVDQGGEGSAGSGAGEARVLDAPPWLGGQQTDEKVALAEGDLLCPVEPTKIVCVGRNYAAHARELGHELPSEPLLFLKPPSALLGPGGTVLLPSQSARVEHEAELAVVIGRRAKNVRRGDAARFVLGYTIACDVTARDIQRRDVQFTRAKSFDTFCPVGPFIETELDPAALGIRCVVRGEVRQDGTTADMIFDVGAIVSFASHAMTLEPGDVILTGTPHGVGPLEDGDDVAISIQNIGTLALRVARAVG